MTYSKGRRIIDNAPEEMTTKKTRISKRARAHLFYNLLQTILS